MIMRGAGLLVLMSACAQADKTLPDTGTRYTGALDDLVTTGALLAHLDALQAIADDQDGTRAVGTAGHEESAAYVAETLEAAGYTVSWQDLPYTTWSALEGSTLVINGTDHADAVEPLVRSPGGEAAAPIVPVDVLVPITGPENTSTSGCEADDFADFPAGAIALLQRGTCGFIDKARNAEAAGAVGVVIFNEGQADRQDVVQGSLVGDSGLTIPVLGASYALGELLVSTAPAEGRMVVVVQTETILTWNLLADLPGTGDDVVVVGAHLDSVPAGPGINDNGSGTALVLELARLARQARLEPLHTLRFAWWSAEEVGLVGSYAYVEALSDDERDHHLANLNFDMIASPNGGLFVYDGDASDTVGYPPPAGSDTIEGLFTGFFDAEGLSWEATAFDGRSDYGPFIAAGIPAGGLFSGAEAEKSSIEAAQWGGTPREPYDACYHRDCDSTQNIDPVLFLDHARAAAHVTQALGSLASLGDSSSAARMSHADLGLPRPIHHACGEAHEPAAAVR